MEPAAAVSGSHSHHSNEVYENFDVHLRLHNTSQSINAHFGSCFFSALDYPVEATEAFASVEQSSKRTEDVSRKSVVDLKLEMSLEKPSDTSFVPLGHAPRCPARFIHHAENESLKKSMPKRDLRVGVCCVVEHQDKIMITRRSATLRTFPLKWVFPGGHVNYGERLEDAARREVLEETGLHVTDLKPFACWESCFPTFLENGPPTAHHLVIYYLARLDEEEYGNDLSDFNSKDHIKLQVEECDAAAWLDRALIRSCLQERKPDVEFSAIMFNQDGSNLNARFKTSQLLGVDHRAPKFESLALGTAFVLQKWLLSGNEK